MTKYKEYFDRMIAANKELFNEFERVHDEYVLDDSIEEKFNEIGKRTMAVMKEYEQKLCSRSEGNGYGAFTGRLAENFWKLIRDKYPKIDYVGIITKVKSEPSFILRKLI